MDKEYDLAEDYFFAKWPKWVRWFLFFPSAIICSLIFSAILKLIYSIGLGEDLIFLLDFVQTAALGALFVYIGAIVAPSKQFEVSIILLILLTIFGVIGFQAGMISQTYSTLFNAINILLLVGSGVGVVFYIHKEAD